MLDNTRKCQSRLLTGQGEEYVHFGSYRLGVFGPGSDIDALVVAPKHCTREDFFEHFPTILRSMSKPDSLTELKAVSDAYVPIIKFDFDGISIDLLFGRLQLQTVASDLDLKDNSLLRGLDDTDLRCVNGTRVTDEILDLVPEPRTFRHALRGVKLWAQRRAVYANVMGFPGGVAWAMMVARICQLYPRAPGSLIILKFFNLLQTWRWPEPILLKPLEDGPLQVRIWNPQLYPGDKKHIMPVITPAYPSMCATHNITRSTMHVIRAELKRASHIAQAIFDGKKQWRDLFEKQTFFTQDYKYYLSIVAGSKTKEAQLIWSGLVESKVRRLVTIIEDAETDIAIAHPFNKGFERVHRCQNQQEVDEVLQGSLKYQAKDVKTATTDQTNDAAHQAAAEGDALQTDMTKLEEMIGAADTSDTKPEDGNLSTSGESTIYTTTYYVGLKLKEASKDINILKPVNMFKSMCVAWQQYDAELNSIRVVHTRNFDLPDDVFEAGEVKPVKAKKKVSSKAGSVGASAATAEVAKKENTPTIPTKRNFTESNMDGEDPPPKKRASEAHSVVQPAKG